ncbi:MAG: hypothetical protein ACP5HK_04045 [Acidilobus sp.]
MYHVERLVESEVRGILDELGRVDLRLRDLQGRDDDESRLEYIVLSAYRRHLIGELESLASFASEKGLPALRRPGSAITPVCTG